jgi:glycerol-3-phosphate dehydrogenase
MLGPTAEDRDDKEDTSTSAAGLERLREAGARLMPELLAHEVTAAYAGLRAATEHRDYQLIVDAEGGYLCAGGIRSTGLTASMAIAEWARDELDAAGLELRDRPTPLPAITMPNLGEAGSRPYQDTARVAADPAYGEIVCFCERVSLGELRDASSSPLPPADLDGLRRRTRALMGRCQGFFCGARVAAEHARLAAERSS